MTETIIHDLFKSLNIKFKSQCILSDIYNVDFLLYDEIVINFNGSQHYMADDAFKLNMKSTLKNEILKKKGYYIVNINFLNTQGEESNLRNIWKIIKNEISQQVPEEILDKYNLNKILFT